MRSASGWRRTSRGMVIRGTDIVDRYQGRCITLHMCSSLATRLSRQTFVGATKDKTYAKFSVPLPNNKHITAPLR
jgi:hypothetical protein